MRQQNKRKLEKILLQSFKKGVSNFKDTLEDLYVYWNKPEFRNMDPVAFIHRYDDKVDIEIVGLLSSSLAFGNIKQIMKSLELITEILGRKPFCRLKSKFYLVSDQLRNFKYRFVTSEQILGLLKGALLVIEKYGSIESCIVSASSSGIKDGLKRLCFELYKFSENKVGYLVPSPFSNSAFKRMWMYFRWMVRHDNIDIGIWNNLDKSDLIVPLDTHMFFIGRLVGFTLRSSGDETTAQEITEGFRRISPLDPVRYDFCLTRSRIMGI